MHIALNQWHDFEPIWREAFLLKISCKKTSRDIFNIAVFKMLQIACNIINPALFQWPMHVPGSQGGQGIFRVQPTLQIYTFAILLALPVHAARLAFEWLILISISACEKFWIAEK